MSAWLVRILPDLRHADARRDLTDAVRLHQRLMRLAPQGLGEHARQQAGVLYRLDETTAGPQILVQTHAKPETAAFPDAYGRLDTRDLTPLLHQLRDGDVLHYRIAANTSKRLSRGAGPNEGKVVALRGADAEQWWADRAQRNGLALRTLNAHSQPDSTGTRNGAGRIRHAITRFDGIATVADTQLLRTAVLNGIGRGKSHGCGLLSIAPLEGSR
jgi:CRISPR system Cascade subunit CasE